MSNKFEFCELTQKEALNVSGGIDWDGVGNAMATGGAGLIGGAIGTAVCPGAGTAIGGFIGGVVGHGVYTLFD